MTSFFRGIRGAMGRKYKDGKEAKTLVKPTVDSDWDTLTNKLRRAADKEGLLSSGDMLGISVLLSTHDVPMPNVLRDFLSRAILEIIGGVNPAVALRIKKPTGRPPKWSTDAKVRVCNYVNQYLKEGMTLKDACSAAAKHINTNFEGINTLQQVRDTLKIYPAWIEFFGRKIPEAEVRDWFQSYSPKLLGACISDDK